MLEQLMGENWEYPVSQTASLQGDQNIILSSLLVPNLPHESSCDAPKGAGTCDGLEIGGELMLYCALLFVVWLCTHVQNFLNSDQWHFRCLLGSFASWSLCGP